MGHIKKTQKVSFLFGDVFECKHFKKTIANLQYSLYTKLPKINCYKYLLIVKILSDWNSLLISVAEVDNITNFKRY